VLIGRKLCSEYLRSLRSAPFVAGTIFKFTATKVQNSTFKYPTGQDFSVEFGLKSLDTMMRLAVSSQVTNLTCHVHANFHILLHYVITIHQRCRYTDGRLARTISAQCYHATDVSGRGAC